MKASGDILSCPTPKISERAGVKKARIQKTRATPARFASSDGSALHRVTLSEAGEILYQTGRLSKRGHFLVSTSLPCPNAGKQKIHPQP